MKIYVNYKHEIKAIESTNDVTLTEYEVDRAVTFGEMSDFRITHYCYKPSDSGFVVYPAIDLNEIDRLELDYHIKDHQNKIDVLQKENAQLNYALMIGGIL